MWSKGLKEKYPDLLSDLPYFECNKGWEHVLDDLFRSIVRHEAHYLNKQDYDPVKVDQVKEKFGGLRVSIGGGIYQGDVIDTYYEFIKEAELKALKTCEQCGSITKIGRAHV